MSSLWFGATHLCGVVILPDIVPNPRISARSPLATDVINPLRNALTTARASMTVTFASFAASSASEFFQIDM